MTVGIEAERNTALIRWYREHGRDLPWRASHDPYAILVSEVMSQQTQVSRVVPHYELFLSRFPTVEALAAASLADVLAAWSGLGYNTRAERLHQTSRMIVESGWPDDAAGLAELPGIGPYTARAVAAFAFGEKIAAVDTNLRRVLSRWYGEPLDAGALEVAAAESIDTDAATWNQAIMDLGAVVCRPRLARCDECPVEEWCTGPDVYVPPRPQSRFEGSVRQVRGAIVRTLVATEATLTELAARVGVAAPQVLSAVEDLIAEGLVVDDGEVYRIPN